MRVRFVHVFLAIVVGVVIILATKGADDATQRLPDMLGTVTLPAATSAPESAERTPLPRNSSTRIASGVTVTALLPAYPASTVEGAEPTGPSPEAVPATPEALWLSPEEIGLLPTDGAAWNQLLDVANEPLEEPDLYDQDDEADVRVLAHALVYARTGEMDTRDSVVQALEAIMDQDPRPHRTSILPVARNLPAYVIAADLIDLAANPTLDNRFREWLRFVREVEFSGDGGSHTIPSCHETRPNNFGTHCGAARLAIALYLGEEQEVARAADVFHGWLGNREAYTGFEYGRLIWQADPEKPVGINPPDAVKDGHPIGGALPEEMRRPGDFRWPPRRTGYAWEALQGAIVQAELLARAGYPAWEWEDQALLRAVEYLYELGWEARGDDAWQPWLINHAYGTDFPTDAPARPGKNMGWTDWTHGPQRSPVDANASIPGGHEQ